MGWAETRPPICQENINHQKRSRQRPGNRHWVIASFNHPFSCEFGKLGSIHALTELSQAFQQEGPWKQQVQINMSWFRAWKFTGQPLWPFAGGWLHLCPTHRQHKRTTRNTWPLTSATPLTFPLWSLSHISWKIPRMHLNGSVWTCGLPMEFEKFGARLASHWVYAPS